MSDTSPQTPTTGPGEAERIDPANPLGPCRVCGRRISQDVFGQLKPHTVSVEGGVECLGSGEFPQFDQAVWDQLCRNALQRAIGWHRMQDVTWDEAERDALKLRYLEEDAISALRELAEACARYAEEIVDPAEQQDERKPFRYSSLAMEFEAATIAMAQLAEERNRVRPPR